MTAAIRHCLAVAMDLLLAMRTAIIDMPSGVAGDMLLAALLHAGADRERLQAALDGLGLGPLPVVVEAVRPSGLAACRVTVQVPQDAGWDPVHDHDHHDHHDHHDDHHHDHHDHRHRPYAAIRDLLDRLPLPERVRDRAQRVFRILAEAEGAVHGVDPEAVHFHEVGSLDAIVDVLGVCLCCEQLGIDRLVAGPLLLGAGTVRCAHGRMPVPVPAVLRMVADHRLAHRRAEGETGELTTPTGCALVAGLCAAGPAPGGAIVGIGCGAGHRSIAGLPGFVRVTVVDEADGEATWSDQVVELRATMDDASGEELAVACDALRAAGARDVHLVPLQMKKGRSGVEVVVVARVGDRDRLAGLMLTHTPTIGVRASTWHRWELPRQSMTVEVAGRPVRCKVVTLPDGSQRVKPEADDCQTVAAALGWPWRRVADAARQASG